MAKEMIKSVRTREILDSRGNPTVEVEVRTASGVFTASAPSGVSRGKYEAVELRDANKERYRGRGVLQAVKNVNEVIAPMLVGKDVTKQKEMDDLMRELDGTENKSRLGGNAIVGTSMAVCRAGAAKKNIPLYRHIAELAENSSPLKLPKGAFNIVNGGAHAGNELSIQEFMVVPQYKEFTKNLQTASEIYQELKGLLQNKYGKSAANVGDEGGFAPPAKSAKEVLTLIMSAAQDAKIKIILDAAASQFFKDGKYHIDGHAFDEKGLLDFYTDLILRYPITGIEDPFAEEDWGGFAAITKKIGGKITIIGDDLLVTNPKRIQEAKIKRACNGLLLKVNQIGTVTEAIQAAKMAQVYGWKIMVSHRSGETCDDFIADLAVGIGSDYIKSGAPARGERVAKYNRLLKIEEELANHK